MLLLEFHEVRTLQFRIQNFIPAENHSETFEVALLADSSFL